MKYMRWKVPLLLEWQHAWNCKDNTGQQEQAMKSGKIINWWIEVIDQEGLYFVEWREVKASIGEKSMTHFDVQLGQSTF